MFRVLLAVSCCALAEFAWAAEPPAGDTSITPRQLLSPGIRGIFNHLPGVSGAVSRLTTDEDPGLLIPLLEKPDGTPPILVQVRLSQDYLAGFLEREVNHNGQVRETILGTSIVGTASTQGATTLVLHNDREKAVVEVILTGIVQAQTVGRNGPVQLHCSSYSPFKSRKIIELQADGIKPLPATTVATTRSTTHQIRSTLPGLRGRLAERIARNRAQELRGRADAIASKNTARRLNREFDQSVEKSLSDARGAVQSKLRSIPIGKLADHWRYRSEPGFIEMTLSNPELPDARAQTVENFETDAAVAVRIHRGAVRSALTTPDLRESLRPLLAGILAPPQDNPKGNRVFTRVVADAGQPEFRVCWSQDRQWLEFHFSPDSQPQTATPAKLAISGR